MSAAGDPERYGLRVGRVGVWVVTCGVCGVRDTVERNGEPVVSAKASERVPGGVVVPVKFRITGLGPYYFRFITYIRLHCQHSTPV